MPIRAYVPLPGPFAWTPGPPGPSWGQQIVEGGDQVGGSVGSGLKRFGLYVGVTIGVLKLGVLAWLLSYLFGDVVFVAYGGAVLYLGWILERTMAPLYVRLGIWRVRDAEPITQPIPVVPGRHRQATP
ncbi:hypothetical protein WHI96_07850 [Pseudonocardia tropica]|uniref:Uncharacterized protein n=1 Tax=Pseudonocardia tropica TaxID=681289 RepID=A0ABV1JS37_9PSEU